MKISLADSDGFWVYWINGGEISISANNLNKQRETKRWELISPLSLSLLFERAAAAAADWRLRNLHPNRLEIWPQVRPADESRLEGSQGRKRGLQLWPRPPLAVRPPSNRQRVSAPAPRKKVRGAGPRASWGRDHSPCLLWRSWEEDQFERMKRCQIMRLYTKQWFHCGRKV